MATNFLVGTTDLSDIIYYGSYKSNGYGLQYLKIHI